jgi:L-ribulose-5-phosphate 3-epimerase
MTRRECIQIGTGVLAAGRTALGKPRVRVGVMDTSLRKAGKVEAVELAAKLGFEGIQVSIGREVRDGKLPLSNAGLQAQYLEAARKYRIPLASTYLDILHVNCLKNDPLGSKWVAQGIGITQRLKARILMTVFFGKCALQGAAELDAVVAPLKELAPTAQRAGVILGFESTISAEDNLRVLERVNSPALQVFYDIGNATNMGGFDVPAEIRRLGKKRICQFHFKDKGYLGEGKVDVVAAVKAIREIGYEGFVVLETGSPSGKVEEDLRRNLEYTRRVLAG